MTTGHKHEMAFFTEADNLTHETRDSIQQTGACFSLEISSESFFRMSGTDADRYVDPSAAEEVFENKIHKIELETINNEITDIFACVKSKER